MFLFRFFTSLYYTRVACVYLFVTAQVSIWLVSTPRYKFSFYIFSKYGQDTELLDSIPPFLSFLNIYWLSFHSCMLTPWKRTLVKRIEHIKATLTCSNLSLTTTSMNTRFPLIFSIKVSLGNRNGDCKHWFFFLLVASFAYRFLRYLFFVWWKAKSVHDMETLIVYS